MSETDLSGAGWVLNENCYEKLMEEKLKVYIYSDRKCTTLKEFLFTEKIIRFILFPNKIYSFNLI